MSSDFVFLIILPEIECHRMNNISPFDMSSGAKDEEVFFNERNRRNTTQVNDMFSNKSCRQLTDMRLVLRPRCNPHVL